MPSIFRIHPAFGVARVGDAEAAGFIGPEQPDVPANWNLGTAVFDNFKVAGRIKRQGVRFRVFEFGPDGSLIGEALPGQRDVEFDLVDLRVDGVGVQVAAERVLADLDVAALLRG